jgi:hypothetical protein
MGLRQLLKQIFGCVVAGGIDTYMSHLSHHATIETGDDLLN